MARWAGVDLTRINGLAVSSVLTVLSEIGPDLSRFANVKRFCSWLGLCPGTKISGRQGAVGAYPTLDQQDASGTEDGCQSLSRNGLALGAFYRCLCARMDKPSANTATAHKLARMVYFMLTRCEDFVDQRRDKYTKSINASAVWPHSNAVP
jgi:transposase